MSEPRISDDVGTKEAGRRVDGGPEEYKATGALRLKNQCLMGIYMRGELCSVRQTCVAGSIGCALGPHPLC